MRGKIRYPSFYVLTSPVPPAPKNYTVPVPGSVAVREVNAPGFKSIPYRISRVRHAVGLLIATVGGRYSSRLDWRRDARDAGKRILPVSRPVRWAGISGFGREQGRLAIDRAQDSRSRVASDAAPQECAPTIPGAGLSGESWPILPSCQRSGVTKPLSFP